MGALKGAARPSREWYDLLRQRMSERALNTRRARADAAALHVVIRRETKYESLGLALGNGTRLVSVYDAAMPAQGFVGRSVTHVNGKRVSTESDILAAAWDSPDVLVRFSGYPQTPSEEPVGCWYLAQQMCDDGMFGSDEERRVVCELVAGRPCEAVLRIGAKPDDVPAADVRMLLLRAIGFSRCGALPLAVADLRKAGIVSEYDRASASAAAEALCGLNSPLELLPPTAENWHQARRRLMAELHPEVRDMQGATVVSAVVLSTLLAVHLVSAVWLAGWWSWLPLAATVGSVCAYSFQALTHELWHQHRVSLPADAVIACASALCNFPWRWYYTVHHPRHHADTGGNTDFDGIVLFRNWHAPLLESLRGKWWGHLLWSFLYSHFIFFFVAATKAKLGTPLLFDLSAHGLPARLRNEFVHVLAYFLAWYVAGWPAVAYLWWSAAFSLGCLGHPHMGFWLLQHQCPVARTAEPFQPTLSYYGSKVWGYLNFQELLHVEHHDFPRVPWVRLARLRDIAPDFYDGLQSTRSVTASIRAWLTQPTDSWMRDHGDFAGQESFWTSRQIFASQCACDLLAERCCRLGVDVPWDTQSDDHSDDAKDPDDRKQE
eukprot:TRINITY_DN26238_c0_g1_i1.p1 TRINITY_DN26238_c0_g1~~TRINITY_DN26238_c0_g1_i1.p1  ORF type:complete len:625 (+),score=179.70 TRINITY_DN26238_c0_g1_i1:61-1875(+)